tara:strand:+ start:22 stop:387 length:366 start_codon:yes stop_codon:yes gene_type:complete
MIHLTTAATKQTINIIPRNYASTVNVVVRDDSTNTSTTYSTISTTTDKNYLQVGITFSPVLVEGRFYDVNVKEGTSVIYKDTIFCTDQTINQTNNDYYSVNEGAYTVPTGTDAYDNDYIII